jgi:AraC-like DNA-binding protein
VAIHSAYATEVPGQAEEFLSDAYLEVDLSLPDYVDGFRLAVERLDTGDFYLDTMEIAARAAFDYEPDQEYFVSTVGRGTLRVVQRGVDERLAPGEVALIGRPGVETRTEVDDFRQGVVTLPAASLRRAAGLDPDSGEVPEFASIRPGSAAGEQTLRHAVAFVSASLGEDLAAAESPLLRGSLERLLTDLVLATFPNGATAVTDARVGLDARSPATLRRAVAFIEANAERDVGIDEIAAAARVTRRAVQLAFRRHLDTTPTAYLRRVRLDAAHRELLAAAPDGGLTVTEVAYRWGFCSPSRFTERYRAAFGTTPSRTLRR